MECRVCSENTHEAFTAQILSKYDVKYYHCDSCGFLQTEEPYWLEESYQEAINITDTGIVKRNRLFASITSLLLACTFPAKARFLDYAGGYGLFVRMMRDMGFDFYWQDPWATNSFARGFEYNGQPINLLTAFEVFEHLVSPRKDLKSMLEISDNILFSTVLLPDKIPAPKEWWYYGLEHGQHISFYSRQTLKIMAEKHGLRYYHVGGSLHLLTGKQNGLNPLFLKPAVFLGYLLSLEPASLFRKSKTLGDAEALKKRISTASPGKI